MAYNHLFNRLAELPNFDSHVWSGIEPYLKTTTRAALTLTEANRYDLFFLHTGVISMHDSRHDGITHFIQRGDIVPDSYLEENTVYQALQGSEIVYLDKHALSSIHVAQPDMHHILRDLMRIWLNRISIHGHLLSLPKNRRKEGFKTHFPFLPSAISNITIANYLAMTPEYFSRTGW